MADSDPWKEIEVDLSLYKFYLEFLLKGAAFVAAMSGGIVSYGLAHRAVPMIEYALALPFLCSAGCALVCYFGYGPARQFAQEHEDLCKRHGVGSPYDFTPLKVLIVVFGAMFVLIAIGLVALFGFLSVH